jgi:hypothetical protein
MKFKFYGLTIGLIIWNLSGIQVKAAGDCDKAKIACLQTCSTDIAFKKSDNNCGGFCEYLRKQCAGELQGQGPGFQ